MDISEFLRLFPHTELAKHSRLACSQEGYIYGDWKVDLRGW